MGIGRPWLNALVAVALAGCSGARAHDESQGGGPSGGGIPADAAPLAAGCPPTWAAMPAGGACDRAASQSPCNYPEGSCWCGAAPRCSGAAIDPEEMAKEPTMWNCTPVPPKIRPDGCPGSSPNGACSEEGKRCVYGDCCVETVQCQGGKWVSGAAQCPP